MIAGVSVAPMARCAVSALAPILLEGDGATVNYVQDFADMAISGQHVVEALERAGYRIDRRSHDAVVLSQEGRMVLVPLRVLDEEDILSIRMNARLTMTQFIALLEPPTLRDLHFESHVRKKVDD